MIWTAGVAPSPAAKWLVLLPIEQEELKWERIYRSRICLRCLLLATRLAEQDGKPLPGVAQVAMQQGRYVGKLIHGRITGKSAPGPFRYFDKGNMAVVGKGFAVLQSGKLQMSGLVAWLAWAFIHIRYLRNEIWRACCFNGCGRI